MDPTLTTILGAIIAAILGGGFVAYFRAPSQNRADAAKAGLDEADAVGRWQDLYEGLQERLEVVEQQAAHLRDLARQAEASAASARLEAQKARTQKSEAETRVAELEAELARAIASASEERHALRGEFEAYMRKQDAERLVEREKYEIRIAQLEERVETLSAQLGQTERRGTERRGK